MTAHDATGSAAERSFAQRLFFTTPMRDLVRGRVSGRLDLTIYPERAGLPGGISTLVVNVTKRTRLRILEKADVAREISAHFAEGLAGGKDADELIESFGDPKQAARLIRRAKKRNRSRIVRAVKRAAAATFAVIAILYAGVLIWYVAGSGKVNPSHDYLADLNAVAAAVPVEDRAWPVYREAFLEMGVIPDHVRDCTGPNDYRWPETVEYIAAHQGEIEMLRRGAAMPGLGYIMAIGYHDEDLPLFNLTKWFEDEPDSGGSTAVIPSVNSLIPSTYFVRQAAHFLRLDALRILETGSTYGAIDDIAAMIGVARQTGEHPILISQLIRLSIHSLAVETAGQLLAESGASLTDHDLTRLENLFDPSFIGDLYTMSLEGERMFLLDVEQYAFTDDGHGNGSLRMEAIGDAWGPTNEPFTSPLMLAAPMSVMMPDRKAFHEMAERYYDATERASRTPLWERDESELLDIWNGMESTLWRQVRWTVLRKFLPALNNATARFEIAAMHADTLRVAIALNRYRLANNRWPDTLAQLVPAFLDAVPPDRFDGHPLRYKLDDEGHPILYSIGANFIDDGGVPGLDVDGWPTNDEARSWRPRSQVEAMRDAPSGDYILWPTLPVKPIEPEPEFGDN